MRTFTKSKWALLGGGLLALLGGLPLVARAYAHLNSWGLGLGMYGQRLSQATLLALGVAVLAAACRKRSS